MVRNRFSGAPPNIEHQPDPSLSSLCRCQAFKHYSDFKYSTKSLFSWPDRCSDLKLS